LGAGYVLISIKCTYLNVDICNATPNDYQVFSCKLDPMICFVTKVQNFEPWCHHVEANLGADVHRPWATGDVQKQWLGAAIS